MERRIDVNRGQTSAIDNDFSNMRDRFEQEMRRVEDEMHRLREEFEGRRSPHRLPVTNQSYSHSSHHESSRSEGGLGAPFGSSISPLGQPIAPLGSSIAPPSNFGGDLMAIRPTYDPYMDNLKSPLIRDESDGKTLRLRFDVSQYKPEEVTVKTIDNRLLVHAKHEEKTPQRTVFREYNQEFLLPTGTDPERIMSTLSTDGILTVEAPLPQLAIKQ